MKSKSRLGRISKISIAGLFALGLIFASQARLSANQPHIAGEKFSPPAPWVESDGYGWTKTWKGEEDRKAFISVIEDDSMKGEIPNPSDQKFIEVIKSASSVPHFMAGIKNWNVEKLERTQLPEGHKLVLIGTYLNSKGEQVRFEEWKYFLKDGYGQINYSELAGPKARDRAQVAELLKRYRPFGT
jgi:hypothetical protein